MPNYVIIDTSVYRELGLKFYENIDYKNLCAFTIATDSEVLISDIVVEEFTNYYRQLLQDKHKDYAKAINSLSRDPFFEDVSFVNISGKMGNAITKFQKRLRSEPTGRNPMALIQCGLVDGLAITKFILESKNEGVSNVQVRDYLIWETVLTLALDENKDRIAKVGRRKIKFERGTIYFIAKDKIFNEGNLFIRRKKELGISNVVVYHSIPQFLHEKGFNIPFVTEKLIQSKLTANRIIKDLKRDIGALLSYVSPKYNSLEYTRRKVESAEVISTQITEYYSYVDASDSKPKYIAHLRVVVKVVFEKDENEEQEMGLPTYNRGRYLETYDAEGRPFYNAPINFYYRGLLDMKRQTIKSVQFIDFLPLA